MSPLWVRERLYALRVLVDPIFIVIDTADDIPVATDQPCSLPKSLPMVILTIISCNKLPCGDCQPLVELINPF